VPVKNALPILERIRKARKDWDEAHAKGPK
jgi:hypothetical protein